MDYEFLPKGSTLFKQGDESDKFYIITQGSVLVLILKDSKQLKAEIEEERYHHLDRLKNNKA